MQLKLKGKKLGMTQLFDDTGRLIACTVIEVEPNVITQKKTEEIDGYNALQVGYKEVTAKDPRRKEARVSKPLRGHFKKAGVEPRRHLVESKVSNIDEHNVGEEVKVTAFAEVDFIDVTATTIGKGYQGAMKLHGFKGGPASHGSKFHRELGSTGGLAGPGRSFPGGKRPSQMGNRRKTVHNLKIMQISEEDNLIVVKGAIPGPKNCVVTLRKAIKKH